MESRAFGYSSKAQLAFLRVSIPARHASCIAQVLHVMRASAPLMLRARFLHITAGALSKFRDEVVHRRLGLLLEIAHTFGNRNLIAHDRL